MGFLKKHLNILLIFCSLSFFSGCAKSIIKIVYQKDDNPVTMFAETGERNFYVPITISDSLSLIWERDTHGSFNNSSFLFFDSTIIVHDLGGRVHTFNIHTGKQTGVLKNKGSVLSTPVLINYSIVIPLVLTNKNKTELIFYDYFNGKELDLVEIDGRVINQLLKIDDDVVLITEEGTIKRINLRGNEKWNISFDSFVRSNPAYSNGRIYFASIDGEFFCLDAESSRLIYRKKLSSSFNGGVTIKSNNAYLADTDGIIYSIKLSDGGINWVYNAGSRIQMNPALDNENLFIGNLSGEIFSITQNTGALNWKEKFNGAVFNSTPLITDNRIIISNLFKSVFLINKTDGKVSKEISLNERVKMTPAIKCNILFLGYDRGTVRAYEIVN